MSTAREPSLPRRMPANIAPTALRGRIAMFYEQPGQSSIVAGRMVAVRQMVQAVGMYTPEHQLALMCPPRQVPDIATSFAFEPGVVVVDRTRAPMVDELGIVAWHEADLRLGLPFAVRERAARMFPITMVHHTLSYKSLLHGAFLQMLLARPRSFDSFVCTSTAARDALQRILTHVADRLATDHGWSCSYEGRFDVIPLATDTERFRPMNQSEARQSVSIDPDAFVILWVGRLSPIDKADLMPLVGVVAELCRAHPNRTVQLVCAGSQRPGERFGDVLEDYARSLGIGDAVRIITDESLVGPWMAHLYASADVFVSPSDNVQESFGLSPIEAMAAGVPQVVSDWSGYRDTVVEGETGFRIPTTGLAHHRDIDELAVLSEEPFDHLCLSSGVAVDWGRMRQALEALMDNDDLRARMGEASRKRAVTEYAWPVVIARYAALWLELADRARGAERGRPALGYQQPQYGTFFQGYASRHLTDDVELWLTQRGQEMVASEDVRLPLPYGRSFGHIEPTLILRALQGLAHFADKGQPLAVGRAVGVLMRSEDHTSESRKDAVRRHLVWLLKYGYAALAPTKTN